MQSKQYAESDYMTWPEGTTYFFDKVAYLAAMARWYEIKDLLL